MLEYAQHFSKYRNKDAIVELKRCAPFFNRSTPLMPRDCSTLSKYSLEPFEVAQLATLVIESPEEAYALIPSLEARMQRDTLDELLKDLEQVRRFQY